MDQFNQNSRRKIVLPMRELEEVTLHIQGIGHCPSFKNHKMITPHGLITKPERQRWMEQCIRSMMWQLLYSYPISANETVTAQSLRSWIASALPAKDSWKHIPTHSCRCIPYPKKLEGASLTIRKLEA